MIPKRNNSCDRVLFVTLWPCCGRFPVSHWRHVCVHTWEAEVFPHVCAYNYTSNGVTVNDKRTQWKESITALWMMEHQQHDLHLYGELTLVFSHGSPRVYPLLLWSFRINFTLKYNVLYVFHLHLSCVICNNAAPSAVCRMCKVLYFQLPVVTWYDPLQVWMKELS